MLKYNVNQYDIDNILNWIQTKEIAIPEIQRPFVWKPVQVRDLIDSLYKGYPIGYVITWKNPSVRLKDGKQNEGQRILIDGQQRITALMASILGYPVVDKNYKKINISIAFNPLNTSFDVTNTAIKKDKRWIPDISTLLAKGARTSELLKSYKSANPHLTEEEMASVENSFDDLKSIKTRKLGVIELNAELGIDVVTEIFIRINRDGVVLSQADFVMSKIAADEKFVAI
jgi:uncharacterized protein with ParB-like and HNH nuclease domain